MSAPIKATIEHRGQSYVDEPVLVRPKMPTAIEYAVGRCFNSAPVMARRTPQPVQVAWQMVELNWIQRGTKQ